MKVIVKYPNKDAEVKEIGDDYEELSTICEGLIDVVSLPTDSSIDIICNDEFLYNGMEANIVMPETEGILAGPLVFAGYDPYTGDTISLTDEQIVTAMRYINRNKLHNMSLEGAYRYSKVIRPLQECEDKLGIKYWEVHNV